MKKLSLFVMLMAIVGMSLALASCSNTGSGGQLASGASPIGTWQLVQDEGETGSGQQARDDSGFATFLILKDDGTALYEYIGSYYAGSFEDKGAGTIELDMPRARLESQLSLKDGELTATRKSGETLTFKKIEDSARQSYDEKFGYDPHVLTGGDDGEPIVNEVDEVLVDDEFCTIKLTSTFELSSVAGFDFEIVNKTDSRLGINSAEDSVKVAGESTLSTGFSAEVEPNATATATLGFSTAELGGGLDKLENVTVHLRAVKLLDAATVAEYDLTL